MARQFIYFMQGLTKAYPTRKVLDNIHLSFYPDAKIGVLGVNGSGMHTHMSLWKEGSPLFYDENGYAGLSETALYFIGGVIRDGDARENGEFCDIRTIYSHNWHSK